MEEDVWKLERLIFGLRHVRTFAVSNKLGEIVDQIIPLQGFGPFPDECFAKVSKPQDALSIELKDEEDTLAVRCGVDGVILECDMLAEPPVSPEGVCEMFDEVVKKVVAMTEARNKINRLGVIFRYSISPFDNSAKELFGHLLKIDLKGTPDNIHVRMALKNPVKDALYHPESKTDFQNAIIEISSVREDEKKEGFPAKIQVSVDYQMYYEPARTLDDVDVKHHFEEGGTYVKDAIRKSVLNFQPR